MNKMIGFKAFCQEMEGFILLYSLDNIFFKTLAISLVNIYIYNIYIYVSMLALESISNN